MVQQLGSWTLVLAILISGCGSDESNEGFGFCAPLELSSVSGGTGNGFIFTHDPLTSSGDPSVGPNTLGLDQYKSDATLRFLGGRGVLEGSYVDVRDRLNCMEGYGAYREDNDFRYSYGEKEFQEVMSYHHGTEYRAFLDTIGVLEPKPPILILAHCMIDDNAFYTRGKDKNGQVRDIVCLGDSRSTPAASYADSAPVGIHENQHATTVHTYSVNQYLGPLLVDPAGALNEAISDFMSLIFLAPEVPSNFDPKVFGRWALGLFIPNSSSVRGANRCPEYSSDYPNCTNYQLGASGFSADQNIANYGYPDGLGWPYANNYLGPGFLKSAFDLYPAQEEIHNLLNVMVGALWEAYENVKAAHAGDHAVARDLLGRVVHKALADLPFPTTTNVSPVTFVGFAAKVVEWASTLGYSNADQDAIKNAMRDRGLFEAPQLSAGWLAEGPGQNGTSGMKILDNPSKLKSWLYSLPADPSVITQSISTGLNNRFDPGEAVAVWFDLKNNDSLTAGELEVNVKSLNSGVTFLGPNYNFGYKASNEVQLRYYKVNGTGVVQALSSTNSTYHVATGNSYFLTNPFFASRVLNAIWVQIDSSATGNASFQIDVKPENGPAETITIQSAIN